MTLAGPAKHLDFSAWPRGSGRWRRCTTCWPRRCPIARCSSAATSAAPTARSPSGPGGSPRSSSRAGSACAASGTSWSAGSAARTPSPSCSTTAPSTSRRCSALPGPRGAVQRQPPLPPGRGRVAAGRWSGRAPRVYHRRSARCSAEARRPADLVLVDVDDGSGVPPLPGSTPYEDAVAAAEVGGLPCRRPTTSTSSAPAARPARPKAVLWRQADIFVAAMGGQPRRHRGVDRRRGRARRPHLVRRAAAHARRRAVDRVLRAARRRDRRPPRRQRRLRRRARSSTSSSARSVNLISIVGDAYARPLVEELRARRLRPQLARRLGTGGAVTSDDASRRCSSCCPTS